MSAERINCQLRNRIIEHLELVASAEEQLAYQQSVPNVRVSNELFNAWSDWAAQDEAIEGFTPPVFSSDEKVAIRDFNAALDLIASQTPQDLPDIADFIGTSDWLELSSAANKALAVLRIRGVSPEHRDAI